jgi:hypothetical protein
LDLDPLITLTQILGRLYGGMIAEHWDIIEAIPPKSEWKNDNGKFWLRTSTRHIACRIRRQPCLDLRSSGRELTTRRGGTIRLIRTSTTRPVLHTLVFVKRSGWLARQTGASRPVYPTALKGV